MYVHIALSPFRSRCVLHRLGSKSGLDRGLGSKRQRPVRPTRDKGSVRLVYRSYRPRTVPGPPTPVSSGGVSSPPLPGVQVRPTGRREGLRPLDRDDQTSFLRQPSLSSAPLPIKSRPYNHRRPLLTSEGHTTQRANRVETNNRRGRSMGERESHKGSIVLPSESPTIPRQG